jgi:3-phosphoshikimate 1-carboxyvinyltransferase
LERPLEPYRALFEEKGIGWEDGNGVIRVSGRLTPGIYQLRGDVSSQFISGLLFALPLLPDDSRILLTTQIESRGYIELTRGMQEKFGVRSRWEDECTLLVPGNQRYNPSDVTIEGDWSHAAFYVTLGAMGGDILLSGLDPESAQGDRAIKCLAQAMGARIGWEVGNLRIRGGTPAAADIDVSQIPDLVPALCALACAANGTTRIRNAARLRAKESDRLSALAQEFGTHTAQVVGVEYLIGGNVSVKASTSTRGTSAIDLFWRYRY